MPDKTQTIVDPEITQISVEGDCGHVFKVALARLEDGAEFVCPECGQADRFDEADLRTAKKDIAKFNATAPLDRLGSVIGAFLSKSKRGK